MFAQLLFHIRTKFTMLRLETNDNASDKLINLFFVATVNGMQQHAAIVKH